MKKAYLFLADGFEEIEGLTVVDILRRAGVDICSVSIMGKKEITGAHNIEVKADALYETCCFADGDMFILPGGMPGTKYLGEHKDLCQLLQEKAKDGAQIAAICAAPSVLGDLGLLQGKKAICYPGFESRLAGAAVTAQKVVTDGNITTSQGMGTAIPFALRLTEILVGKKTADEIRQSICYGHQSVKKD